MSRRQRVVVVVDEDVRGGDPEEFRNILDLSMSIPSPALKGFKSAIYAKWATHAHTQPLRFDCVGTTRNAFVRAEYAMLMDELFLNRSSCCLLQFFPLRECQISFLCNLLVSEVDKRMMVLQAKLLRIKVEYFDLRKYDVINFLGSNHPRSTTKNQRNSRPHNLFGNTLDLLRWLQTRYLQLFGKGQGTENLDLEFTFSDSQTRVHTVRLSIMHVFLCHMDSDTKTCLRNCFENIRSAKRGRKSIMLTDCLREILGPKANWFTWFVFHVPIAKGRGIIIDDQLNLASSAYAGINAKESSDVRAPDDFDLSSLLSFLNVSNDSQLTVNSQLGASVLN
uniref:Galactokinase n=1 Tax=Zeugodacus cucurbitae TaxID=28588 RepID=A0A0A1WTT0_ZEUCU